MKHLIAIGICLMLLGGGLTILGSYKVKDKHEIGILGADFTVTETDRREIPRVVSGSILGVGVLLTVVGAVRSRARGTAA